jgi:glycosyltransferase involved in cell wall biosynthesis
VTALVFAAPSPPFPLDNGGRIRMHRLLTGLATEFATTLVTYEHDPESGRPAYGHRELEDLLPGIAVVTVPGVGPGNGGVSVLAGLRAMASPLPASWRPYHRDAFVRALVDEVQRRRAALVHFDYFAFFPAIPCVLNVRAPHNVESAIARQEAARQRGYGRVWHEAEWRKLRSLERRTLRSSQLCVAVSDLDARAMAAAGARRVAVCPNGTDPVVPWPPPRRRDDAPLRILFVGSGSYPPYERGLAWFVREVLPLVYAQTPATLDVVGHPPERPISARGVSYVGTVPDLATWYERAHVAIVPVFEGSGTRLKVIEAMAHGRPVVSTRLGAEGLPIESPAHYLQADRAAAFADSLLNVARWCCTGDGALLSMLQGARSAIEPLFWPEVVGRLGDLYRAELDIYRGSQERSDARAAPDP